MYAIQLSTHFPVLPATPALAPVPIRATAKRWLSMCVLMTGVSCSVAGAAHAMEFGGSNTLTAINDADACGVAVRATERRAGIPSLLLGAISLAESGRTQPDTRRFGAWPWTINVAGKDFFFESKGAAIAGVLLARATGVRSIDVGCMQINLLHHPNAFVSLDQAFDPVSNTEYAADFLNRLRVATGNWAAATAAYHSMTPELGAEYQQHVAAYLPQGSRYGMDIQAIPAMFSVARVAALDPYNVMTPELRARVRQDAADRAARNASMGLLPAKSAIRSHVGLSVPPTPVAHIQPAARPSRGRGTLQASLF